MKHFIILLAMVVAAVSAVSLFDQKLNKQWEEFKVDNGKNYAHEQEESLRRLIWEKNYRYIEEHNKEADAGVHTFWLAMNRFGDMTNEEFRRTMNGFRAYDKDVPANDAPYYEAKSVYIPESVDWRTQGYVTPIRDQGSCGSCWAFSAISTVESRNFKVNGVLVEMSEQNLVDCSKNGNYGCEGGWPYLAFVYMMNNKGICLSKNYPYTAKDETCKGNQSEKVAPLNGYLNVRKTELALTNALANEGPISVAIHAGLDSFRFYSKGIYYDKKCNKKPIDHAVVAVGYGTSAGNDFYIVRNSWGKSWGEEGYIRMARNKSNHCRIASEACFPLI